MKMNFALNALRAALAAQVLGQAQLVDRLLIGLLANGHLLVEGLPGLGKTRAIKVLGAALEAKMSRIQFTPDLLPADITGSEMLSSHDGSGALHFHPGPIFANLVLADEINRAPAKVQAALLEAMEERQVTVAGTTHPLPDVFLVMATQNPIEQEGTYPLPEAQLDRFLMHIKIAYPSADDERAILQLVRDEDAARGGKAVAVTPATPSTVTTVADLLQARNAVRSIHAGPAIDQYMVDLVQATRTPQRYSSELARWIEFGASPRGTLALDRCARAHAYLCGRDFIGPQDVRAIAHDALRHRLVLSYDANAAGIDADHVIDELIRHVTAV